MKTLNPTSQLNPKPRSISEPPQETLNPKHYTFSLGLKEGSVAKELPALLAQLRQEAAVLDLLYLLWLKEY